MKKGIYHAGEDDLSQLRKTGLHGIGDKKKLKNTWHRDRRIEGKDIDKLKKDIEKLWRYGWPPRNIAGYLQISEPQLKRLTREIGLRGNKTPVNPRDFF